MSRQFTAHVYENDYEEMQKLVQQYPNIETGGDLFGLWQDEDNVVIQLFIGPGKSCQRTSTSFHQDVDYLHRVGTVITREEGLCNVGEWHSHHQIGMPNPSASDERTVLSNMPQLGLNRFVLFIASIESFSTSREPKKRSRDIKLGQIKIRAFLFREGLPRKKQPIEGKIVKIKEKNPLRIKNKAKQVIERGAEPPPQQEHEQSIQHKIAKSWDEKGIKKDESNQTRKNNPPFDENTPPNGDYTQQPSQPPNSVTYGPQERSKPERPWTTDRSLSSRPQRETHQSQHDPCSPVGIRPVAKNGCF